MKEMASTTANLGFEILSLVALNMLLFFSS